MAIDKRSRYLGSPAQDFAKMLTVRRTLHGSHNHVVNTYAWSRLMPHTQINAPGVPCKSKIRVPYHAIPMRLPCDNLSTQARECRTSARCQLQSLMPPRVVQVVGVDRVIAVELQRPGVDTESTFFEVPVQNCMTERLGIEHYAKHPQLLKGGKVGPSLRHQSSSRIEKAASWLYPF